MEEGYFFKDGHDFFNAEFCLQTLKVHSTKENKICLKFVNKLGNLEQLVEQNLNKTKYIYQFYITEPTDVDFDIKHVKIKINSLMEIKNIL